MFRTLANAFRIPELRNKLLFTIALLCVYRIGFYVPLPGVNPAELARQMKADSGKGLGFLSSAFSLFSGGDLSQSTIFGLGIMPYISASIILQLLATVLPSLEKLRKEGEPGMRKINEWTRYLTVVICVVQSFLWLLHLTSANNHPRLLYAPIMVDHIILFWVMGLTTLTAGSLFLMWLGEQIDEYGLGNGVSLIITAGIISRMPIAAFAVLNKSPFAMIGFNWHKYGFFSALQRAFDVQNQDNGAHPYNIMYILFLMACFVLVVCGSILLTQAQRRIRIQQAKQMRGRKVYGGTSQYLPLRVNHAGVMPIIFASSLMIFPSMAGGWVANWLTGGAAAGDVTGFRTIIINFVNSFYPGQYLYEVFYIAMIFFFSYFWNTVQFQPKEMANQLRDYGSFIPGLRPGKRTADYLENVMMRITYVGAAFLCIVAIIPSIISTQILGGDAESYQIAQFLGGTGLLIVIQVMLDFVNRIEASLVMRNYGGFMDGGSNNKIKRSSGGPVRGGPRQPQPSNFSIDRPKGLPT